MQIEVGGSMIDKIEIENFRCFERLEVKNCARINIIVGDNGAGKTALLEAIFLALGSGPELAIRFRQMRGLDGQFFTPSTKIHEALFQDMFYGNDMSRRIHVKLTGKSSAQREVSVLRGESQLSLPIDTRLNNHTQSATLPVRFVWKNAAGTESVRSPVVTPQGIQFTGTDEDLPYYFFFYAFQVPGSVESASRFSELSRSGNLVEFKKIFIEEYKWIEDLNLEMLGGVGAIFATLKDGGHKVPVSMISGGINRLLSIMLAMAHSVEGIVLVDELENGIHHSHHAALWRGMLNVSRKFQTQLFAATHNIEWLESLFEVATDRTDIAFWRIERSESGPVIRQFSGEQAASAIKIGEIR